MIVSEAPVCTQTTGRLTTFVRLGQKTSAWPALVLPKAFWPCLYGKLTCTSYTGGPTLNWTGSCNKTVPFRRGVDGDAIGIRRPAHRSPP
jgi:hypothetical protein